MSLLSSLITGIKFNLGHQYVGCVLFLLFGVRMCPQLSNLYFKYYTQQLKYSLHLKFWYQFLFKYDNTQKCSPESPLNTTAFFISFKTFETQTEHLHKYNVILINLGILILLCLTVQFTIFIDLQNRSMLSNLSVNLLTSSRPQSAHLHPRAIGSNFSQLSIENPDSVFLNNQKIILPLKEYSNKFLRQNKPRDQLMYNHSVLKPKKSLIYVRKQIKHKKSKYGKVMKDKQNESCSKSIKTQASMSSNINKSQILAHSICGVCQQDRKGMFSQTPSWKTSVALSTPNKVERISTSRALQMFSKVFKNENIERMKIKKQIFANTSDVQVKQVTLQDKQQRKKIQVGVARKPNIHPISSIMQRRNKTKNKMLFMEEQNFELAGW